MMSEKKLTANRENARRSTGPRTAEGKEIASRNAVTHGLCGRDLLLPGEDESELTALRADLGAALTPVGGLETMWFDIIVATLWKRGRLNRLEQGIFEYHQNETREVERLAAGTRQLTARERLAVALIRDAAQGDQFGKLARYEGMLGRQLVQALHELERLQAVRQGVPVAPPAAVDIVVSAPESTESPSITGMSTADAPPAPANGASDAQGAMMPTETPCPAGDEAVDAAALPDEPSAAAGTGSTAAAVRNEATETR